MIVRFWGVRGSIPTPSPTTVAFGGNTPCVSADLGDDLVIFDAGTGLRPLGLSLLRKESKPRLHLFVSHVHWDHIQGFPFFAPARDDGFQLDVYGRGAEGQPLRSILAEQMDAPNFPVPFDRLEAAITFRDIGPDASTELPGGTPVARVTAAPGRHPGGVLVYRLADLRAGRSMVYATDTEHSPDRLDGELLALARGADLLVYDGMYTPEEYPSHREWGHSTWEKGLELAAAAGVGTYVVFHHDPDHDDVFLTECEASARALGRREHPAIRILFAREGMEIDLREGTLR